MYAVIKTGGKQYRVAPNDQIVVERLVAEAGDQVRLGEVLMIADGDGLNVGAPMLAGAAVDATVVDQPRGAKILVFKKRRRKSSRTMRGHRQHLTVLRIDAIHAEAPPLAEKPAKAPQPKVEKPTSTKTEKPAPTKAETPTKARGEKPAETPAPAAKAKKADAPAPEASAPATEAAGTPPELLSAAPDDADDLKKITGVGPKLAATLNEIGIHHYAQIAAWTPENIAWVDEQAKAKGRIERDDWVGQAKALAAGKEG